MPDFRDCDRTLLMALGRWFSGEDSPDAWLEDIRKAFAACQASDFPHLIDGEFQSDKYPTTPRGKVPLSVSDKSAQDLLWIYAERHRKIDAQFSDDLQIALRLKGYNGGEAELGGPVQGQNEPASDPGLSGLPALVAKLREASRLFDINVSGVNRRQRYPLACDLRDAAESLLAALPEMEQRLFKLQLALSKAHNHNYALRDQLDTRAQAIEGLHDQLAQSRLDT